MSALWAMTRATYMAVVTRPFTLVSLSAFAVGVFMSQFVSLFAFTRESQMVREMGASTMTLWGLLIAVLSAGPLVGEELEDKTALLLLSKPLKRSSFLLGKFLGIVGAQAVGILLLAFVLFLTLWCQDGGKTLDEWDRLHTSAPAGSWPSVWEFLWDRFIPRHAAFAGEAAFLGILQVGVLTSISVSLAAFLPAVVMISATTLLYLLGNVTAHFAANIERSIGGAAGVAARGAMYFLPNLSYFNLEDHFREARLVQVQYLLWATCYAIIYAGAVMRVATALFDRREIR